MHIEKPVVVHTVWTRASAAGRMFYAIAMLAFGALHIGYGDFVTRVVPWWPAAIPGRSLWASAVGVALMAGGAALFVERGAVTAATLLGTGLLVSFACLGFPAAATDAVLGGRWTVAGKALAFAGGAFLLAEALSIDAGPRSRASLWTDARVTRMATMGTWFLAWFLVQSGIQHFIFVDFVISLVPTWMPGGGRFWTYAAAIMLIAGGVGMLVPMTARLAAALSGLMIFSWVFLVHIPRAAATFPRTTGEMTAVFEALAMSGIAWLVAARSARDVRVPVGEQS